MKEEAKPMSNWGFRGMAWWYKLRDLFDPPERHLERVKLGKGMTVVDYGCGPGSYTIPVAQTVGPEGRVFAVDIHPLAIDTVKQKAQRKALDNVETVLVDGYDTGIADYSVDRVLLIDTIHHIADRGAFLQEIHRILKKDGLFLIEKGHVPMSQVQEDVEKTGIFRLVERWRLGMLAEPL